MKSTVYFDNAATTFPKPLAVRKAVMRTIELYCANPGRSSHRLALKAAEEVYACREKLAKTFGGKDENVVFTSSATHSINIAVKSLLKLGDHILISDIEHNAVYRPVSALAERGIITYDIYRSDSTDIISELSAKAKPNTAMIIACHHSNICNISLPLETIGAFCEKNNILFLVDASQSAGILPVNATSQRIDILCAPAHKGLYGIPGGGFAMFSEKVAESGRISTFMEGGNGISSKSPFMPEFLPERLEAGTLPLPAITALSAGIDFVNGIGTEKIRQKEKRLCKLMRIGLEEFSDIRIHSLSDGSIMLFSVKDIPSEVFASRLDSFGICVRAGLHCSPLAHKKLSTPSNDGAVRVSFGLSNSEEEVMYFLNVCEKIVKQ